MKKLLIIIWAILLSVSNTFAQDIEQVLVEIENNNTQLIALRKAADAELLQNKTGIFLENPEAEFHYLWGSPNAMGNRTDITITQSFDFPTVYSHQSKISDLKNKQVELNYLKSKKEILLEARQLLHQLTFVNASFELFSERLKHAGNIASSYRAGLEAGSANILEVNKAELNLLNIRKVIENLDIERKNLSIKLQMLNGGKALSFSQQSFYNVELPSDFDEWYGQAETQNPMLNWLKEEIAVSEQSIKLNKAQSLPKLNAGYMSENQTGNSFQGLIVGVSIPLWENKNTVKYAKAQNEALVSIQEDRKLQFYKQLESQFQKAKSLESSVKDYQQSLNKYKHAEMLEKALIQGQITLIEYLMELRIFYDSQDSLLEMQRDLHLAIAELYWFM